MPVRGQVIMLAAIPILALRAAVGCRCRTGTPTSSKLAISVPLGVIALSTRKFRCFRNGMYVLILRERDRRAIWGAAAA